MPEQYYNSTCGNRFLWYQELPHNIFGRDMWYKIFLKYHTGVPHSKTTHQYHTSIPQYHTAVPHRSTTQQNHTSVPHINTTVSHSSTTQQYKATQEYHTAKLHSTYHIEVIPHSSTTQHYHAAVPHSSITQHYHTAVPHITTQ